MYIMYIYRNNSESDTPVCVCVCVCEWGGGGGWPLQTVGIWIFLIVAFVRALLCLGKRS